jgi:hypothetical protein
MCLHIRCADATSAADTVHVSSVRVCHPSQGSNLKGLLTLTVVLLGLPTSLRVGHVLDRAINECIYEREPRRRQVTVAPVLERGAIGVSAHVRF